MGVFATLANAANTKQNQRREVRGKRFQVTLIKHLYPPVPEPPQDLLVM